MSGDRLLDRAALIGAFSLLDEQLSRRGARADVYVVGGAAMALAWDARRTTRDVDGLFVTDRHQDLIESCRAVARLLDLPDSWLNEQASAYAPRDHASGSMTMFDGRHLRVLVVRPEVVFAMKVRALRPSDLPDIDFLADHIGLTTVAEMLDVHDRYFPGDPLPPAKLERLEAHQHDR